ncbi:MAG: pentapeptide repeat-containing protein [Actinomycetes bacterium]
MHGACLTRANLSSATLTGATLTGANLTDTILSGATWWDGRICATPSIGTCK